MSCIRENKKPHVAAVILARGGSKGLLGDNNFDGIAVKPLLLGTLEPAIACGPKVQVFDRSDEHATDEAFSVAAMNEFLAIHKEVDIVGLIQCTSPFIEASLFVKACNLITSDQYDSVFAAIRKLKLSISTFQNESPPLIGISGCQSKPADKESQKLMKISLRFWDMDETTFGELTMVS
ncbi:CMAS [Lepeophtheirus salmonis]|uniref:CMAS n=1 Tax=Lepeophtheirus salmonis TaxID=72036 RepID=A0A7R8D2K0_LEPSM|nr:CMAS [Lepeophtheirus salmonis]CAF3003717.1 CMAS [Lepeophtheirus salmonis]